VDNILITGKEGFIGKTLQFGKAFKGDLNDSKALLAQTRKIKGVVHLAAISSTLECEKTPRACIQSNLLGLINILEVALKRDIWVLFISTFQIKDRNLYGLTKLVGEELCRLYQRKGLRVKILRLPIVYGANDRPTKIVTKFIGLLKNGVTPAIDTNNKFYFLYVTDAAKVIEQEVNILEGKYGKKYSLYTLCEGIKAILKENKSD
jgi:nucleoside-diphosphate-sugar epimerase